MPPKTTTATTENTAETERLRALIRDLIQNENDIDLSIPDEEIDRIVAKATAPLIARIVALEAKAHAIQAGTAAPVAAARVTVTPRLNLPKRVTEESTTTEAPAKSERIDILRASAARVAAKKKEVK